MSDIASGVAAREGDLVALTRDLIRIPTINPPGGNYLPICRFIAARLERSGFVCALLRAEGAPGDGDRHPRWNLVARREGGSAGPCVHFNGHTDVVEVGRGWTVDPFGGELRDGRVYGRGACDMKGGIAAAIVAVEAFLELHPDHPGAIEILGDGGRGDRRLRRRRLAGGTRTFQPRPGRPRHHPRTAEQGPRLSRPSRRLVGGGRDLRPHRARIDAVPRRLRGPPYGRGDRRDGGDAASRARGPAHRDAGGAGRRAGLHDQHQLHPWRSGRAGTGLHRLAVAGRARQLPDGRRPAFPDGGGHRGGEG